MRRDAAHEEKHAAKTLPARKDRIVRRHREMFPIEEDRDTRGLLVSGFDERAAVELRDADPELERRCDARELP